MELKNNNNILEKESIKLKKAEMTEFKAKMGIRNQTLSDKRSEVMHN
jgi:hypothetical protein